MKGDWRCECGAINNGRGRACEGCGQEQMRGSMGRHTPVQSSLGLCPHDGTPLDANGVCPRGGGYPVGRACPFACPLCRQPLNWSGGCFACHGTVTGRREDWTFPGDGYYTHTVDGASIGDGQHWVKQHGPRPACPPYENNARVRQLSQQLGAAIDVPAIARPRRDVR